MTEQPIGKLAVILHADVVGSTVLVQRDERWAHQRIIDAFQRFSQTIEGYGGKVQEIRGDALLAEFARASDAVCAALAFQQQNTAHNKALDGDIIPEIRIGVALGEVVIADNTITGAGVVLAQRIEQLCEPGGVYITEAIREALPSRLPLNNENLGKHELKGFEKSARVYAVRLQPDVDVPAPEPQQVTKRSRTPLVAAAVVVSVVVGIALMWLKPWQVREEPAAIENMALPLPDKPSIAVLPFDNLSGDPEKEYMVDGMSEHIISSLARIPEMFVVARNSTFFYKSKAVDVRQVAEDLGVQYVLEGSLQTAGDRVRITAQLIDALSGLHVWSEHYDRSLGDFFALQDDITHKIGVALLAELAWGEQAIIEAQSTNNLKAWLLFQQGDNEYQTYTREGNARARKILHEAVELDPNYAQAWAFLGWTHFIDARFGYSQSRSESVKRANQMVDKAASIYPELAEQYFLRAYIHMIEGELDEAVALGQQSLEAAPGNATYNAGNAMIMLYAGKFDASIEFMKKAKRLSPHSPTWYDLILGRAYAMKRDYKSATSTFSRIATEKTSSTIAAGAHTGLAFVYSETGRDEEARAEIEKALERIKWLSIAFYQRFGYFKDPAHSQRFEAGLRKAGLPERPPFALPDKPSIAVLPFTNLTGDSEQDYFVDGFYQRDHHQLIQVPRALCDRE